MQRPKLKLAGSKQLTLLLSILYLGTVAIIWQLGVPGWIKVLLLILASGYTWYSIIYNTMRISSNAVCSCWVDETGRWHLQTKRGKIYTGNLRGESLITPRVTVLSFKVSGRYMPLAITITKDAVEEQAFRQLRVYLRTEYAKPTGTDAYQ